MRDGKVAASGAPGAVVTAGLVKDVFGMAAEVADDPISGTPMIVPIGRHRLRQKLKAAAE